MSSYTYREIIKQARLLKKNVEKDQKMGMNSKWAYYFAKAIKKPNTNIKKISFEETKNPVGDYISRDVAKADYLDMAKRLINYVENPSDDKKKMPNFVTYKGKKVLPRLVAYAFAKVLVYYEDHKQTAPKYVTISSKAYEKQSETGNVVFDYFVKKTGFKPTCLDDVCDWVIKYVTYLFYFDDWESNKEVIDNREGNCTDLLQFLINMAEALGYEWKVIHTQCAQSGTGHVYGKFRKKGSSEWFIRDIACIADNSDYCVWCNVDTGAGYLLEVNPAWFLENLHR